MLVSNGYFYSKKGVKAYQCPWLEKFEKIILKIKTKTFTIVQN